MANERPLRGARILLAEDNAVQAFDLKALLEGAGAEIVGPARTVAEVLALAASASLTCAVLDVILRREQVFPAVQMLRQRGAAIIFYTGSSDAHSLGREWPAAHIIMKPASAELLIEAVRSACTVQK